MARIRQALHFPTAPAVSSSFIVLKGPVPVTEGSHGKSCAQGTSNKDNRSNLPLSPCVSGSVLDTSYRSCMYPCRRPARLVVFVILWESTETHTEGYATRDSNLSVTNWKSRSRFAELYLLYQAPPSVNANLRCVSQDNWFLL